MTDKSAPAARVKTDLRDILGPLGPKTDIGRSRRALLPGGVKFFSWLFFLVSAGGPPPLLARHRTHTPNQFTPLCVPFVWVVYLQAPPPPPPLRRGGAPPAP